MNEAMSIWPTVDVAMSVATATFRARNPQTTLRRSSPERVASSATISPTATIESVNSAETPTRMPNCARIAAR